VRSQFGRDFVRFLVGFKVVAEPKPALRSVQVQAVWAVKRFHGLCVSSLAGSIRRTGLAASSSSFEATAEGGGSAVRIRTRDFTRS